MLWQGAVLCMVSVFLAMAFGALHQKCHPLHQADPAGILCPQVGRAWLRLDAVCLRSLPARHAGWDHLSWDAQHHLSPTPAGWQPDLVSWSSMLCSQACVKAAHRLGPCMGRSVVPAQLHANVSLLAAGWRCGVLPCGDSPA